MLPHFSGTMLQVPSKTNSSPQRWPIWKLSTHVLSLSYRHLLELRRRFPHTQSQLSPHRILGASQILQCHICAVAGHLLGISVDPRCWKQSRGPRYLWNNSWFACWSLPGKAAAHSCWNFLLLSPDLQHQLQGLWLCHGLWKGTPDHWDVPWSAVGSAGHKSAGWLQEWSCCLGLQGSTMTSQYRKDIT